MVIPSVNRIKGRYSEELIESAYSFLKTNKELKDNSFWAVRAYTSLQLFLWHLEAFEKDYDPTKDLINNFNEASDLLLKSSKLKFFNFDERNLDNSFSNKEDEVSSLFSDIWLDMTDDIYFDETFRFTCERLEKNGIDKDSFFKNKVVLDAGCGSGKFSSTIAKLGAKKVIGLDIGERGLNFARKQQIKRDYCSCISYQLGSLLDIPLDDNSIDMVWSNGVIHHTSNYIKCIKEFNRVLKSNGQLFLYVDGCSGLFEILQDTLRIANEDIPRYFFQYYLNTLKVNSGRLYWLMDSLYAPYEYKTYQELKTLLEENSFKNVKRLLRGVEIDQIEQISKGMPFADIKYGEGQIKVICEKN